MERMVRNEEKVRRKLVYASHVINSAIVIIQFLNFEISKFAGPVHDPNTPV